MELALQSEENKIDLIDFIGHNPCFYGISFAIMNLNVYNNKYNESQSLFLWN